VFAGEAKSGAFLKWLGSTSTADCFSSRFHLQHGPIDIIGTLEGDEASVLEATNEVWERFQTVLPELVAELPLLRTDARLLGTSELFLHGLVAKRMYGAVQPYADSHNPVFITPMAAVAGCVADEMLRVSSRFDLRKVLFNNGGDVAIYALAGQGVSIQLLAPAGFLHLGPEDSAFTAGVATSGWSGRSFSLGIADAVSVVAATAGQADAAATVIANEVGASTQHPAIERRPANCVKDDSDLGNRWVTVNVGPLPKKLIAEALWHGEVKARQLLTSGLIYAASLSLQGESVIVAGQQLLGVKPSFPTIDYRRAA
jgi:uncharacterized protein